MSGNGGFWHAFQEFFRFLFRRFEALGAQIHSRRGRYLVVGMPLLWFGIFFAAPLLIVLKISLAQQEIAQPPYQPLIQHPEPHVTVLTINTGNYHLLWRDFQVWFASQHAALGSPVQTKDQTPNQAPDQALDPTGVDPTQIETSADVLGADSVGEPNVADASNNQDPTASDPYGATETGAAALPNAEGSASGFADPLADDAASSAADPFAMSASDSGFATNVGSELGEGALEFADDTADFDDEAIYAPAFMTSIRLAFISTLLALLIGYPMAYLIAKSPPRRRMALLLLVVLPFWTSSLLRTYAWLGLLKDTGPLNGILLGLGVIDQPLRILDTEWAIYIGMVYNYLPFMVLPLVANLVKLDPVLLEAASDLGAKPWRAFLSVTLPLSMPGILAGCMLVFIPCIGEFVIPDLLGGGRVQTIGMTLWNEFFKNTDWPLASSIAIGMLMLIVLPLIVFEYLQSTRLNPAQMGGRR